ncbi:MAG: ATP-binding protein [Rhizobiaceae bacterium]
MRSRLFLKVYLTLMACLAAVALATGVYWRIVSDREETGWMTRRDTFLAAMLPAGAGREASQQMVDRLAQAFDADISLYDAAGGLIASAGPTLPLPQEVARRRREFDQPHDFAARLADGRTVVARLDDPRGGPRGGQLGYLLLIAAVIGAAAYPVVRHLTRRLESLRRAVEKFGEGDLDTRVPIHGRDEVAAVATSFNAAADRIGTLVGAHRSLLANASHELRSPLARLRMASELNAENPSEAHRKEMLESLDELDQLVEEILLASRLDHVGPTKTAMSVDLLALAAEEAARHGIEANGTPAIVQGDAKLLTRLVRNLIVNAFRHGAPPVEVFAEMNAGKALISVRDHGPGIPESERERVFEPFYRPAGRGESAGGWGLGLALVRQIARNHGGDVRLETPEGGGARFVVELEA